MPLKYKRIVLKISGEMLGDDNKALSRESIASTARQIQKLAEYKLL